MPFEFLHFLVQILCWKYSHYLWIFFFFFRISLLQSHSVDSLSWASWCWQSSRNSWKIHLSCKYTRLYITEGSEAEVLRHIAIARDCMKAVDQNVWCTSVTTDTKLRLYSVCVLPVLVYGAETLTLTKALAARVDAWCQRRITVTMLLMHKSVTDHGHNPLEMFHAVWSHCKIRVVHGHCRALRASISGVPATCERPRGRPQHTWLKSSGWVHSISSVKSRRRNRMPRTVQFSAVVNDLRVLIDSELTMANHIAALSRSCSFHMRQFQMDFPWRRRRCCWYSSRLLSAVDLITVTVCWLL